jgi:hypothetical protein
MRTLYASWFATAFLIGAPAMPAMAEEAGAEGIDSICATTACRTGGFEILINVDAKNYNYTPVPVNRSPYVIPEDHSILLFPGETLVFQFPVENGKIGQPVFVKALAPEFPAQVDSEGKLVPNPSDANLPPIPQKGGSADASALPPNSLLLSYGEAERGQTGMMLHIVSSLPQDVKFEDTMLLLQPGKPGYKNAHTSTCPVVAGLAGFETWSDPIGPMILSDFRFISSTERVCT